MSGLCSVSRSPASPANNADWYRLLDLCGLTDTLIGDADGVITRPCSTMIAAGLKAP